MTLGLAVDRGNIEERQRSVISVSRPASSFPITRITSSQMSVESTRQAKKMKYPKLTLVYFGLGGRAEAIRLAAAVGKIPFTNKSLTFKDFSAEKGTFPLQEVPVLEIEEPGKEKYAIPQSVAILRYIGKMAGELRWTASIPSNQPSNPNKLIT
mmetsp:Transcript_25849/g.43961  ORF Transcript_25849/g.43961 Transcript_25849/m.43961 type:complete len:154 (-) Transcript_25849:56-517(-)